MTQARGQTALWIKNDHSSAEHPSEPVSLEMLKLDEGVSWAMLVSFAQDMFPRVSTEDIGVCPRMVASSQSRCVETDQLHQIEGRRGAR
jgi:hypothetical protein